MFGPLLGKHEAQDGGCIGGARILRVQPPARQLSQNGKVLLQIASALEQNGTETASRALVFVTEVSQGTHVASRLEAHPLISRVKELGFRVCGSTDSTSERALLQPPRNLQQSFHQGKVHMSGVVVLN